MAERIVQLGGQTFRIGARTHRGRRRKQNEDYLDFFIPTEEKALAAKGFLCVVADGMGGHAAGEVASHRAVEEVIAKYFRMEDGEAAQALEQSVQSANQYIYNESKRVAQYADMGTTLVAAVLYPDRLIWANVGDSRIYWLRQNELEQITEDHSYTKILVDSGALSQDEAESDSRSNIITRSLGGNADVEVDLGSKQLQTGDTIILCSDGLRRELTDEEIGMLAGGGEAQTVADTLVFEANEQGGRDNISVIVIKVGGPEPVGLQNAPTLKIRRNRPPARKVPPFVYGILVGVLLLACAGTGIGLFQQASVAQNSFAAMVNTQEAQAAGTSTLVAIQQRTALVSTLVAQQQQTATADTVTGQQAQTAIAATLAANRTETAVTIERTKQETQTAIAPTIEYQKTQTAVDILLAAQQTQTAIAPTNSAQQTQTAIALNPTALPTPTVTPCPYDYKAHFIDDVTIKDGYDISAGEFFTKTWRIQNTGKCPWTTSDSLIFKDGNQLGAPPSVALPPAGYADIVNVSVPMVSPSEPGHYRSNWSLRSSNGVSFGVDGVALYVIIDVVLPKTTATPTKSK